MLSKSFRKRFCANVQVEPLLIVSYPFGASRFSEKNIVFNIPFGYMIQIWGTLLFTRVCGFFVIFGDSWSTRFLEDRRSAYLAFLHLHANIVRKIVDYIVIYVWICTMQTLCKVQRKKGWFQAVFSKDLKNSIFWTLHKCCTSIAQVLCKLWTLQKSLHKPSFLHRSTQCATLIKVYSGHPIHFHRARDQSVNFHVFWNQVVFQFWHIKKSRFNAELYQ